MAYGNALAGLVVMDDIAEIRLNDSLRTLVPPWRAMFVGRILPARPLPYLSFAIDRALWGPADPFGYRLTNVAIHCAAALAVFGIARRTLESPRLRERYGPRATALALVIAAVRAVHPLQTQAVTYVYQRIESLCGLLVLLAVYSSPGPPPRRGSRGGSPRACSPPAARWPRRRTPSSCRSSSPPTIGPFPQTARPECAAGCPLRRARGDVARARGGGGGESGREVRRVPGGRARGARLRADAAPGDSPLPAACRDVYATTGGVWIDVLARHRDNTRALWNLAAVALEYGQFEAALRYADEAGGLNPRLPIYSDLAEQALAAGDRDAAVRVLRHGLERGRAALGDEHPVVRDIATLLAEQRGAAADPEDK